jgi:threonyl-tRNA synthetase
LEPGLRFLMLQVNRFCCTITTKGHSHISEEYTDPVTRVGEALLGLSSVEGGDERAPERVASRASAEIVKTAAQLKVTTVLLYPFAHLFAELSAPAVAIDVLSRTQQALSVAGLRTYRSLLDSLTLSRSTPRGTPFRGAPVWLMQMPQ